MKNHRHLNCITPPHILHKLLESADPSIRSLALSTLLSSTRLRTERRLLSEFGFAPAIAGQLRRTIYDCRNRKILDSAELVRGEGDGDAGDPSVNAAYEGLGTTYKFLREVFDRNSIDDRGMRLDAYVHYGRSHNNAAWNGRQMVFGDGDGRLFQDFTKSIDVIAHELAHGVTQFTADLAYENQSGALNESMSDVFGSLLKQWTLGQTADAADWLIGADIFTPAIAGDALRSMKNPGHAYNDPLIGRDPQPGHMDGYEQLPNTEEGDWGGVHINSGIPNRAFYVVATTIGGNAWEAPGHIWYESLKASTEYTDFQEFAETTFQMAGRYYGDAEQQAVQAGWKDVGIALSGRARGDVVRGFRSAPSVNGMATFTKQLEVLQLQVAALSRQVASFKNA